MSRVENKIIRGRMSLMADNPYRWVLPFALVEAAGFAAAMPFIIPGLKERSFMILIAFLILAVFSFAAQLFFISAKSGKPCEYEADDEKFIIRRSGMQEECFYYSQTHSVQIEPFSMVFISCGYKVTIETDFKTAIFYYAFGGPHDKTLPEDTPFALLGERIPRSDNKNGDVSLGEYERY
ncbi:MAG: hypothetical protein K2J77_10965 [Oscillospiraceae bacterium]|nr:hypothetical protein [Oscillospiraceae bacterium]